MSENKVLYMRNLIFGAEDSLVSTVGLVSGIAVAGASRSYILLTGIVLIFVEAFSMGVGSFLSEYSTEESVGRLKPQNTIMAASIMFVSYLAMGLVPLWPYLLLDAVVSFTLSIASSLVALFILGWISARILGTRVVRSALRMAIIGGFAIAIGTIVGKLIGQ